MTQEQHDFYNQLEGLNWWHFNLEGLKDNEFLIIIDNNGVPTWGDSVIVKFISQYNIDFWARVKDLKPSVLNLLVSKMSYWDRENFKKESEIYELQALAESSTFEEFVQQVEIIRECEKRGAAGIEIKYKSIYATIMDKQKLDFEFDCCRENGNWLPTSYRRDFTYFKS